VRDVMPRIHVAPYTTAQFPAENHFGAEVKVTLRDGTVHAKKVDQPYGRTSANPLTPELLKEKFVNCARRVLAEPTVAQLYASIENFERLADVREMTALTSSHQKGAVRTALAANA
jgi:2-methylcitrate dehydratase PrpD